MFGDAADSDEPMPEAETVQVGYSLARAYDLWCAWKDQHVMPRAGGYDDQPRRWQRMIHLFNRHYHRAFTQAQKEHPSKPNSEGDWLEELLSAAPYADGASPSWEAFSGKAPS